MDVRDARLGTRLELELLDKYQKRIGNTYISQVLEPVCDNKMVVSAPIFESRYIYVPLNSSVRVTYFHSRHGLCGFIATVTAKEQQGNLNTLSIRVETAPEPIQRRSNYRLGCALPTQYSICSENTKQELLEVLNYKKAITKNLSGSGACLVVFEEVKCDTVLAVQIKLSETANIKARCRVLRATALETGKAPRHELGIHFIDMTKANQDTIIKYIFEQQRILLKRDVL